jgi:glyoxylase-like metal-dependent hydrolase (beta-lactamase superfamily II)
MAGAMARCAPGRVVSDASAPDDAAFTAATLRALGLTVFERGWLSSNGILCHAADAPTVMIDTGYALHAELGLALVRGALRGRALDRIVNTHLHSDHCGGNALLQATWPAAHTSVPATQVDAVRAWDQGTLTYERTGQRCERFRVDAGLHAGDVLRIGHHDWRVHAAPGHDPDAVMLFQPEHRALISGDALWEKRLAIVFPALAGRADAFDVNLEALDAIDLLKPALVIPGHGRPFTDAAAALASSRRRLHHYRRHPHEHTLHARKALVMFHMLEHQRRDEGELLAWLRESPVMLGPDGAMDEGEARECLDGLLAAGVLARDGSAVVALIDTR